MDVPKIGINKILYTTDLSESGRHALSTLQGMPCLAILFGRVLRRARQPVLIVRVPESKE